MLTVSGRSATAQAQNAALPDKSAYTLFNPTPRDSMRELNADRPDKTDCPFTVDAGHFQIEMDFADLTYDAANADRGKNIIYRIAPLNAKIGLFNNIDFQLVFTTWQLEKTWSAVHDSVQQHSGFSGITPRIKINLMGNDGGFFAIALIPFVTVPVTQSVGSGVEGGLGIPYAFDIPGWDVGLQATLYSEWNDALQKRQAELSNSISIGHKIFGPISYSGEVYNSFTLQRGAPSIWTADTWFTYQHDENLRIDGGVYIGLTPSADSWQPWIGMSWQR
ncbi:MAG: transporter [Candidatus Kapaibacterium sp.]